MAGEPESFFPDLFVEMEFDAYLNKIDPVLEIVLKESL